MKNEYLYDLMSAACTAVGGRAEMARLLKMERSGPYHWQAIPVEKALEISKLTNIPVSRLRPDVFGTDADLKHQVELITLGSNQKPQHRRRRT